MLTEAIEAHGGTVVKGLGDGVMATFESAADAVAGAVAVQQAVELHGRREPDHAFAVRVGMSIGDVSAEHGDVFGVPVVEASRLCATAAAGEILAADLVRALARGRGERRVRADGRTAAEGVAGAGRRLPGRVGTDRRARRGAGAGASVPLPAALLGAATATSAATELRERLGRRVGRRPGGACRTVLLAGEPGVGKTRTAAELARQRYGRRRRSCSTAAATRTSTSRTRPFVEALDHYARHAGRAGAGPAARRADPAGAGPRRPWSAGAARRGDVDPGVGGVPAVRGHRVVADRAARDGRRAGAGARRLHWATKPTLQLMQHVVRAAADEQAPLLVIATYRDTDVDRTHPLAAVLADLRRLPGVERLAVENLSLDEVLDVHRDRGRARARRADPAARARHVRRDRGQPVLRRRGAAPPHRDRRRFAATVTAGSSAETGPHRRSRRACAMSSGGG